MTFEAFLTTYPEFKGLEAEIFEGMLDKVLCLFPAYKDDRECVNRVLLGLLIAHFIVIEGRGTALGLNRPTGIVTSSSVGSVSVSMQTPPVSNATDYFFSSTPYGLEYLAYLSQYGGMLYVN